MFIAIDQYGQTFKIKKHPRKELLDQLGATNAQKIYCDTSTGAAKHVGYIIAGLWLSVYKLQDAFTSI